MFDKRSCSDALSFSVVVVGKEGCAWVGGLIVWRFSVTCGVVQSCPLSGYLFVIAIYPLLHMFEKYITKPDLGRIFACADDIGAAVKSCTSLITIFQ